MSRGFFAISTAFFALGLPAYAGNGENVSPPMGESVSLHGAEVGFGVGADVGEAGVAHFRPIDLVSAI
jgi:hypothetical protein